MISELYVELSPTGWLRQSTDAKYVAMGGANTDLRVYRNNSTDTILLRATVPFAIECDDLSFRTINGETAGMAIIGYPPNARIHQFTLEDRMVRPHQSVAIAGASCLAYSASGKSLVVGLNSGALLEYAVDKDGAIHTSEKESTYLRRYTLPKNHRVTRIVPSHEDGDYIVQNNAGQLFRVNGHGSFEIQSSIGPAQPMQAHLIKHHPTLPILAIARRNGGLLIFDGTIGESGIMADLSSTFAAEEMLSLCFTPDGNIVIATGKDIFQIILSLVPAADSDDMKLDVQTQKVHRCAKTIISAQVNPISGDISILRI